MSLPKKIVFLAMDAGDKNLIREWAEDGTLPTIRSLLSRGLVGDTVSVEGLYEGATWPSFYTGVNPARHGFHRLIQIKPGTYEFHRCPPGDFIKQEPFWNRLSRGGRQVAILDVPLAGISNGLNGIQMVEWGSHDAVYGFQAWPEGLKAEVMRLFGDHPLGACCDSPGRSARDFRRFTDNLIEGVRKKCELTLHYLERGDWDFFAQVFTEGHCAGHQCWHLHDPLHPNHDRDVVSLTGDPIREVYKAIDGAIGKILAHVDENALVFFLATHRMAHYVGADFMLEEILENLGVLRKRPPTSAVGPQGIAERIVDVARAGWGKLPHQAQTALKPLLYPLDHWVTRRVAGEDRAQLWSDLDLSQSKCFPHPNGGLVSGIRVNLSGREPAGLVKPGEEMNDFCRQLSDGLLAIVDTATGKRLVKRVMKTSDLFQGERIDHLPDLLVEWNEEIRIASSAVSGRASSRVRATSEKTGPVEGAYGYCRTGDHRPEGLFAAVGPGIQPGVVARTVSIMDIAPTFLNWFGVANEDLDGRPIEEISETPCK